MTSRLIKVAYLGFMLGYRFMEEGCEVWLPGACR